MQQEWHMQRPWGMKRQEVGKEWNEDMWLKRRGRGRWNQVSLSTQESLGETKTSGALLVPVCTLPPKRKVLVTLSCPTLCDPMDCSPPGSSVYGIVSGSWISAALESPGFTHPFIHPSIHWLIQFLHLFIHPRFARQCAHHPISKATQSCLLELVICRVGCHSFLQGTSHPRDWTWVSYIAGRFFTVCSSTSDSMEQGRPC